MDRQRKMTTAELHELIKKKSPQMYEDLLEFKEAFGAISIRGLVFTDEKTN